MPSSTLLVARRILLALAFAAPFAAAQAQNPAPAPTAAPATPSQNQEQDPAADGRRNQKVENIHVEDSGATVDEVRYGGRTQSINVKPKSNMPGYEVLPNDPGNARSDSGANGPRVWNVMKF